MFKNVYNEAKELQEVDDADDTVYEYGLPSEEESGFIDSAPDLYASGKMQAMQEAMDIDTGVDTRTKRERINEQMDAIKSIGRGSITSPVTGVVDTVEAGKMLPELDDKVKPFAPTYTGIESAFEQLYNLGFNRKTAEKAIKDVTGIELKGDTGELIGEFISPVAATKAANAIASSAAKYGITEAPKAISRISTEAKKLFSDAGGFDDLATATAGNARGQTAKMLDKRPLPDTSVTKIIIGQSGKDYDKKVASYNKAKQQLIPGKNRVDDQDAQELWNRTGAQEDVIDNDIVYEIPTAKARLKLEESDLFNYDAPSPSLKEGRASFGDKLSLGDERVVTLDDILDFDELYKQAPYLKNVQVKRLNAFARIAGTKAAYNPESNTIFIASGSPTNLTSDLLHEVEHAVQAADGKVFGGGNFRRILKEDPEYDMLGGAERKRELNKTRQDIITEYSNKDSLKKEHVRGFLTTFPNVPNPRKFIDTVRALPAVAKTGRAAYADVFPYYTDVDNFMQNQFSEINYEYTSSIIDALNFIRTASPKQITSLLSDIKNAKLMDLEKFDAVEKRAVLKYLRDPGEVTARNVQFRFLTSKKDPSITSVAPRLTEDRYAGLGEVPFDVVNKPPTKAVDQLSREAAEKGVSLTDEGYYLGTAAERGSEAQSIDGSGILDFGAAKKDQELKGALGDMSKRMSQIIEDQKEAYKLFVDKGDTEKLIPGTKILSMGNDKGLAKKPLTVEGYSVSRENPETVTRLYKKYNKELIDRGVIPPEPVFIEHKGKSYRLMIHLRDADGKVDAHLADMVTHNPALFTGLKAVDSVPTSVVKEADALQIGVNPATKDGALLKKYDASIVNSITENSSAATAGTKEANKLINAEVADGTKVGIRLNLNSTIPNMPKGLDKLQTLHKNNYNGKALSYKSFATVEDVTFNVSQKGRQGIAARIKNIDVPEAKSKFPAMSVDGKYNNTRNVLDEINDDVVEIGFNPANGHLFVDMSTGQAVKSADVATVILI